MAKKWKNLFEYYGFTEKEAKKYPIVSRILKKLTPERIKKENEKIQKIKLPPEIQKWVNEYKKVGERSDYIWKWTYLGFEYVTLPVVRRRLREEVFLAKMISIILNVLFDDLADKVKDEKLLRKSMIFCLNSLEKNNRPPKENTYYRLIRRIWFFLNKIIKKFPRYKELKDVFFYDYFQFFSAIQYGLLVNRDTRLINLTEYIISLSFNMQGMIGLTIDLMASPKVNLKELWLLREVFWKAQRMGRIGNSITTWEREMEENDFSSEIFAYAVSEGILEPEKMRKIKKEKLVVKIKRSKITKKLFFEWERNYNEIKILEKKLKLFNLDHILKGLKNLLILHLCSRGLK